MRSRVRRHDADLETLQRETACKLRRNSCVQAPGPGRPVERPEQIGGVLVVDTGRSAQRRDEVDVVGALGSGSVAVHEVEVDARRETGRGHLVVAPHRDHEALAPEAATELVTRRPCGSAAPEYGQSCEGREHRGGGSRQRIALGRAKDRRHHGASTTWTGTTSRPTPKESRWHSPLASASRSGCPMVRIVASSSMPP